MSVDLQVFGSKSEYRMNRNLDLQMVLDERPGDTSFFTNHPLETMNAHEICVRFCHGCVHSNCELKLKADLNMLHMSTPQHTHMHFNYT